MKQRSLMPLFSNRNYFPLTRQVSAHANQHKIFLMSWKQWQSWNFLYFASTFSKTGQTFQSFWGQCFIAAELRNVGFKHRFCRRWGVFQNHCATLAVWSLCKWVSYTYPLNALISLLLLWLLLTGIANGKRFLLQ